MSRRWSTTFAAALTALSCAAAPAMAAESAAPASDPASVLAEHFGDVLGDMQQTAAPRLEASTNAGTTGSPSRGKIVWSTAPLEVDGAPVQRALQADGAHAAPANPIVPVRLPLDPGAPITVGHRADAFTITALGADDGAEDVVGDGVLHTATHTDTDTIARAVTGGVETYELIRSADAPERFDYRVDGATPREGSSGVIEIVRDGRVIATVTAPVVVDAQGANVPARLSVVENRVVFGVSHRSSGIAYPVLADPQWIADYDFHLPEQGRGGILFEDHGGGYIIGAESATADAGITVKPRGGRAYTENDYGQAYFAAPPGSRIDKVDFRGVTRHNNLERQTARLALYGGTTPVLDDHSDKDALFQTSVVLDDPTDTSRVAMLWMFTPPCEPGENNCPRTIPTSTVSRMTVQQMIVTLVDPDAPTISMSGGLTALGEGWRKGEGSTDLHVGFADSGSGVYSWGVKQNRDGASVDLVDLETNACDDRHTEIAAQGFPCPETDAFNDPEVKLDELLEGRIQITPYATDYAQSTNNGAGAALSLRLDKSEPTIDSLGGELVSAPGARWQQIRGSKPVRVAVSDRYSGVKELHVGVTPTDPAGPAGDQRFDVCGTGGTIDQPCVTSGEHEVPIDGDLLPDGELEVSAKVTDYVGYESDTATKRIFKDNTNPAATAKGELTEIEDEWTSSDEPTPVTLQGKDRRSGISRLELYARDDAGRRLIEDVQVCDPTQIDAGAGETCPQQISRAAKVDLGDLETGQVTLEAYATDAAGNRDASPDSWDTYVDHDAPSRVHGISAIASGTTAIRVSWAPASDEGSGVAGYEYRLNIDDRTTEWVTTPYPGATIPAELERANIEIRAKDRTGNKGEIGEGILPAVRFNVVAVVQKACKAGKWVFTLVGGYVKDIVDAICDGVKKGQDGIEKAVTPVIEKICKTVPCEKIINDVCNLIKKAGWPKGCEVIQKIGCFASELDALCKGKNKKEKDRRRKKAKRLADLQQERFLKPPPTRLLGRDALHRATGARAEVSPGTVRARTDNPGSGRPSTNEVTGMKKGCQRGHLIARVLGGSGSDPRNFVPLPAGFNTGRMATVEKRIAEAIRRGREMKVEVYPEYRGDDPIPVRIRMHAFTIDARGLDEVEIKETMDVPRDDKCR